MRKLIGLAVVIAILAFVSPAYGAVGVNDKHDGEDLYVGEASNICFEGQSVTFDGSKVTVLANGHKAGVTAVVSASVTNLTGTRFLSYGVINLNDIGSLNETNGTLRSISIGNGTPGQMITIVLTGATGGTLYITDDKVIPTTVTKTGWDDIAMNAALDSVTLLYVDDTIGWIFVGGNSVTVT